METRLTLRPGDRGTRKLVERFGDRLLRVRYVYDAARQRRLKTVELIVHVAPWAPNRRAPRRRDDDIVAVRIRYDEAELRERAKRLGAVWRHAQRLWEIRCERQYGETSDQDAHGLSWPCKLFDLMPVACRNDEAHA